MTGVTFISRDYGVNVSIVRLTTTDNLATAGGVGYLTAQAANITAANNGTWTWLANDMVLVSASDGDGFFTLSADFTRMNLYNTGGGGTVSGGTVAGDFAMFLNSVGVLVDQGMSPSDATKTKVVMANGATVTNELALFADANGTVKSATGFNIVSGFLHEPAINSLTAHAGGGRTSALALTNEINRVTTVATTGDSVVLPAATQGASIVVINEGANPMQVFANGSDTINGIAGSTGISQLVGDNVLYYSAAAGVWDTIGLSSGSSGGLPTLPFTDAITAHAGGGQGSATALTSILNRVTTVTTAGDSIKLPASVAGLQVTVINSGANSMQVFGAGTDTINDVATATGVAQMANSTVVYTSTVAGKWYSVSLATGYSASLPTLSYSNGLTAHAGGTQAAGLLLPSIVNRVTTVATAADSVLLPVSAPGMVITVINNGANAMQVFGSGTDTINGVLTATGVSQLPNSVVTYTSAVAGLWQSSNLNFGYNANFQTLSVSTGLTAHSGGTQAAALALTSAINNITTVAAAADSVRLPVSAVGMEVVVINNGANPMQVFGAGTDTINGIATATGVSQLPGSSVTYRVAVVGNWIATLVAPANTLQFAQVAITAAQFNGMAAAPVQLVAAQGANTLIVIEQMQLVMTFVSAQYASGGIVAAQYDSTATGLGVKATNTEQAADFTGAAASTTFLFNGTSGNGSQAAFTTSVNKGVFLSNQTGAFTTGDSTFIAKVYYRVISTNS